LDRKTVESSCSAITNGLSRKEPRSPKTAALLAAPFAR
jgi:hypothetical protein